MNQVTLIGRLTKDPELRYTGTGKAVANFNLAVNRPYDKNTADFHRIVCFGKTAENVNKYLVKGSQCAITGQVQNNNYEKNGVKHYGYQIIADRVEFLESSKAHSEDRDDFTSGVEIEDSDFPEIDDSDVPF